MTYRLKTGHERVTFADTFGDKQTLVTYIEMFEA
jgi:hypothetical protein